MILGLVQQTRGIGITASTDDIMYAGSKFVEAIPVQSVSGDRCQWAQVEEA